MYSRNRVNSRVGIIGEKKRTYCAIDKPRLVRFVGDTSGRDKCQKWTAPTTPNFR